MIETHEAELSSFLDCKQAPRKDGQHATPFVVM